MSFFLSPGLFSVFAANGVWELVCEEIAEAIVQSRTEGGDKQADSADSDADVSVVGGSATSPSSGGADSSARSVARSE